MPTTAGGGAAGLLARLVRLSAMLRAVMLALFLLMALVNALGVGRLLRYGGVVRQSGHRWVMFLWGLTLAAGVGFGLVLMGTMLREVQRGAQ